MRHPALQSSVGGSPLGSARRARRGGAVIEFAILGGLYFIFLFGVVEFAWISTRRQALLNGTTKAARRGAVGGTLAQMKNEIRSGSGLTVADDRIVIEYNTADDGSGTWQNVIDDGESGSPPTRNAVATGRPLRVKVNGWEHQLLAGRFFSWMATNQEQNVVVGTGDGECEACVEDYRPPAPAISISVVSQTRRE